MRPEARLAIFVGGKSRRMGTAKGALPIPGGTATILEHLAAQGRKAGLPAFLVGDASPYEGLVTDLPRLSDDPQGAGPLAGLRAALKHSGPGRRLIAVACDMPNVAHVVLEQLRDHPSDAPVVAPRRSAQSPWEPMLARYHVDRVLPALEEAMTSGERSFQQLFARLDVCPLELTAEVERSLEDWDSPSDVVL